MKIRLIFLFEKGNEQKSVIRPSAVVNFTD